LSNSLTSIVWKKKNVKIRTDVYVFVLWKLCPICAFMWLYQT